MLSDLLLESDLPLLPLTSESKAKVDMAMPKACRGERGYWKSNTYLDGELRPN